MKFNLKDGYGYALIAVILSASYNVIGKVSLSYGVSPALYTSLGMLTASLLLLQFAGLGNLSLSTFKQPRTFLFSFINILEHVFTLYMFLYISGTEGSLMQRINIAIGLIMAMTFLSRKPTNKDILGTATILTGVYLIFIGITPDSKVMALFWLVLATICQTIKMFLAELHPESNQAGSFKDQARVTGIISFVTSLSFLFFLLIGSLLKFKFADLTVFALFPKIQDFIHPATFIAGLCFGIFNEAPCIYCYFVAIKKVKTEGFLAIAALIPIFTLLGEFTLSLFGILECKEFNFTGYFAISLIFVGSMFMTSQSKDKKLESTKKQQAKECM